MRSLALLTVRNEAAFLLEWIAHHRAVGFTDFLVFSNDCQDGTDTMLDRLQEMGHVTHIRNDGPHHRRGIQFTALETAARHPAMKSADWVLSLDIDEFVNIHAGDKTLPALLTEMPDADAITLTWRLFGNAGIVEYADAPVTETFMACAPSVMHWPWQASMFKTLYRNAGIYAKPGVHRPRAPDKTRVDTARWFDGHGRKLGGAFRRTRFFSNYGQPLHGLVQLNHYPLGAMESYLLKVDRGRAVHGDQTLGMDYWVERNFSCERDETIRGIADRSTPILTELKADARLAELHGKAVRWRHHRFRELMTQDTYRSLFTRLLMTPPSRLPTRDETRAIIAHARRDPTLRRDGL